MFSKLYIMQILLSPVFLYAELSSKEFIFGMVAFDFPYRFQYSL